MFSVECAVYRPQCAVFSVQCTVSSEVKFSGRSALRVMRLIHCSEVHYSAVQSISVQVSSLQCNAVSVLYFSSLC